MNNEPQEIIGYVIIRVETGKAIEIFHDLTAAQTMLARLRNDHRTRENGSQTYRLAALTGTYTLIGD